MYEYKQYANLSSVYKHFEPRHHKNSGRAREQHVHMPCCCFVLAASNPLLPPSSPLADPLPRALGLNPELRAREQPAAAAAAAAAALGRRTSRPDLCATRPAAGEGMIPTPVCCKIPTAGGCRNASAVMHPNGRERGQVCRGGWRRSMSFGYVSTCGGAVAAGMCGAGTERTAMLFSAAQKKT